MKDDHKICPKCKKELHYSFFPKSRCTYCKPCMKKYMRSYKNKIKRANASYQDFDNSILSDSDMEQEFKNFKSPKIKTRLNALADYTKQINQVMRITGTKARSKKRPVFRGPNAGYMTTDYFNLNK